MIGEIQNCNLLGLEIFDPIIHLGCQPSSKEQVDGL